jgi:hypothetical protein
MEAPKLFHYFDNLLFQLKLNSCIFNELSFSYQNDILKFLRKREELNGFELEIDEASYSKVFSLGVQLRFYNEKSFIETLDEKNPVSFFECFFSEQKN